ncbi:MAG TPA: 4Fe-4S dicluster domain-containing protein [Candidatus Kapabacteria bacterium]|nr:4Fe-4S dicluster domain-containing protein [Candidatus Kapabacteria bacterium]HPP39107.1 4Fe-4S dicluster domain-containing protein [Candidatus Kapabacteria bacterium]
MKLFFNLFKNKSEFSRKSKSAPDFEKMSAESRRRFLALMGATTALTATACKDYRDKGEIISYNRKPQDVTYGKANYYASTYRDGSPILIKTREGRPIGITGNDIHPTSKGKVSIQAEASILDLYDPERLKFPLKNGNRTEWKTAYQEIVKRLDEISAKGKEIAIITGKINSPTYAKLLNDFAGKYKNTGIYPIELFSDRNKRLAWNACYESNEYPAIDWSKANVIVAVEADLFASDGVPPEQINEITKRRSGEKAENFNRIYAIEAGMSLFGANADYHIRVRPGVYYSLLLAIYNDLVVKLAPFGHSTIGDYSIEKVVAENKLNQKKINALLNDLLNNQGKSIVYVGDNLPVQLHIIANFINDILSAYELYDYNSSYVEFFKILETSEIENLIGRMKQGEIGAVIFADINPAYILPPDFDLQGALKNIELKIALTERENETSKLSDFVLPINHPFESWGDYQTRKNIVNLQQPVIEPIFDTRQKEAILLSWIYGNNAEYSFDLYHKYLKNKYLEVAKQLNAVDFDSFWYSALHDGFIQLKGNEKNITKPKLIILRQTKKPIEDSGISIVLKKSPLIGDGRYSSNGWLQEIPHPVSKIVWDNYAAISPITAKRYGLDYKDFKSSVIKISIGSKEITMPILLQPGVAEDTIIIELGYGRKEAGTIGTGVGFDAIPLMDKTLSVVLSGAKIEKTGKKYKLFATQEFHKLEDEYLKDLHRKRQLIQDGTVAMYLSNPNFIQKQRIMTEEEIDKHSVNPPHNYPEAKWAMAIDLSRCVGCSNCVAACNVENNIPIVGKEECGNGREMHWMRIDRYYSGTSEEPIVSYLPVLCQHCDMAPCENVCPVVATTHSTDGLNQMTYNRCVGTRYCANNCPYKVRRFNFYDFRHRFADGYYEQDSLELLHNPEVTVRSRGVMEKCTFCVQRIAEARQGAKSKGKEFTGAEVRTACQEACPANAIVFGNVNDPNSEISRLIKHNLGYKLIEILGIKPNVTYLAKLRNTNSEDLT